MDQKPQLAHRPNHQNPRPASGASRSIAAHSTLLSSDLSASIVNMCLGFKCSRRTRHYCAISTDNKVRNPGTTVHSPKWPLSAPPPVVGSAPRIDVTEIHRSLAPLGCQQEGNPREEQDSKPWFQTQPNINPQAVVL